MLSRVEIFKRLVGSDPAKVRTRTSKFVDAPAFQSRMAEVMGEAEALAVAEVEAGGDSTMVRAELHECANFCAKIAHVLFATQHGASSEDLVDCVPKEDKRRALAHLVAKYRLDA